MLTRAAEQQDRAAAAEAAGAASRLAGAKPVPDGVWGTETDKDVELDEAKLREAIKRQEAAAARGDEDERDDRKRGFNSLKEDFNVSAEDMEAYRLKRSRAEDPMAAIEAAKAAKKDGGGGDGYDFV